VAVPKSGTGPGDHGMDIVSLVPYRYCLQDSQLPAKVLGQTLQVLLCDIFVHWLQPTTAFTAEKGLVRNRGHSQNDTSLMTKERAKAVMHEGPGLVGKVFENIQQGDVVKRAGDGSVGEIPCLELDFSPTSEQSRRHRRQDRTQVHPEHSVSVCYS